MVSVKFVDNRTARARKVAARKRILDIMNAFPNWKESRILVKEIRKNARIIGHLEMGKSHPIESIDPNTFTVNEYKALIALGYTDKEVYEALGMSKNIFLAFKGIKK